jgi:hypothetical protein
MLRYLLIALIIIGGGSSANAEPTHQQEMREKQCRFQWVDKGTWTAREERRTAHCVLERWPSVEWERFRAVIACESGWSRLAYNPTGPYVGLGQHVLSSWYARVRSYSPPFWGLQENWRNSRSMLTVTARMMHDVGLGPWSCA